MLKHNLPAVGFGLIVLAGCGPGLYPVRGKVTLSDGTPVAGGQVVFQSQGDGEAVTARGDIEPDGSYTLSTHAPGDGAPAGKYKVQVNPPPLVNAEAAAPKHFDAKYSSFATSGLEFEVKPGTNEFPIRVTK